MVKDLEIIKVEKEEQIIKAAKYFSNKWGVPLEAYIDSMRESFVSSPLPSWFYIEKEGRIIGGIGIIENDFHERKDLTPNLCALYVKEEYQGNGIGRKLLDYACNYLYNNGIETAYLITTHTEFYEKVGFSFYGEIKEDSGDLVRCYYKNRNRR